MVQCMWKCPGKSYSYLRISPTTYEVLTLTILVHPSAAVFSTLVMTWSSVVIHGAKGGVCNGKARRSRSLIVIYPVRVSKYTILFWVVVGVNVCQTNHFSLVWQHNTSMCVPNSYVAPCQVCGTGMSSKRWVGYFAIL